jgi:Tol biopolymer transport system component
VQVRVFSFIGLFVLSVDALALELPYPDSDIPDATPKVFAKNFISIKDRNEFRMSISSDGKQYFYSIFDKTTAGYRILSTHFEQGEWAEPATFSATKVGDLEPFLSSDGQRFYFSSNRKPARGQQDSNIWKMTLEGGQWSAPIIMPFSSNDSEWVASEVLSGKIYFARFEQNDRADIWLYQANDGTSQKLKEVNNSDSADYEPYVDPQERYLIFSSNRRHENGTVNLYISLNVKGVWQAPVSLGEAINNGDPVFSPTISPDGKYLFFSRKGDFYWVNFNRTLASLALKII